ncbi:hypothetical protein [Streptomyces sp. NPDC056883]|uniref:hypothetical protein n=1 Tax=Streptomyces sp. NPDC056883 TaxID=3345959 RepID=UPI0036A50048
MNDIAIVGLGRRFAGAPGFWSRPAFRSTPRAAEAPEAAKAPGGTGSPSAQPETPSSWTSASARYSTYSTRRTVRRWRPRPRF